jgi:hypothetical protein
MKEGRVIAIAEILLVKLPVSTKQRLIVPDHLQAADAPFHVGSSLSQIRPEIRSLLIHTGEDQTAKDLYANCWQSEILAREGIAISLRKRDTDEPSLEIIRPGVIRTSEDRATPPRPAHERRSAMTTCILEDANRSILIPTDEIGLPGDHHHFILSRLLKLALMSDILPRMPEDPTLLLMKDLRIRVDSALNKDLFHHNLTPPSVEAS